MTTSVVTLLCAFLFASSCTASGMHDLPSKLNCIPNRKLIFYVLNHGDTKSRSFSIAFLCVSVSQWLGFLLDQLGKEQQSSQCIV